MTVGMTFPERFLDLKATYVHPPIPEKYQRRLMSVAPQDELSPELIAAIDAAGGRDECNRRLEVLSKYREEYFVAMLDEPVGSPFRTVQGAEFLTSSAEPILLVHCHVAHQRIFRHTVRGIIGERPWGAFVRPKDSRPPAPLPEGTRVLENSPGDYFIDPADSLAAVRGLAALRPRRDGSLLSYTPDGHPLGTADGGRIDTTFLGLPRPMSSFLPLAVRATQCRIVFGVGEMRWPVEDGMNTRFFEAVTRDEILGLDDERLLRRILEECEKMIYANIWSWALWEYFGRFFRR